MDLGPRRRSDVSAVTITPSVMLMIVTVIVSSLYAKVLPGGVPDVPPKLPKHMAPDHSSRETLADYGDHRFRLLYRDANGRPEIPAT